MFDSSKDLFYIVLSFCVLWFTVFLCWFLFYLIKILKQTNDLVEDLKEKIENALSHLGVIGEGIKKVISYVMEKRKEKEEDK